MKSISRIGQGGPARTGAIIIAAILAVGHLRAQVASSGQQAAPGSSGQRVVPGSTGQQAVPGNSGQRAFPASSQQQTPGTRVVTPDARGTRVVLPGNSPRVRSVLIGTDRRTNFPAASGVVTTNGVVFNSGVPFSAGGGFGTNGAFAATGTNAFGGQIGPRDGMVSNRAPFLPTNIPSQLGLSNRAPFLPTNRMQLRPGMPTAAPTANPSTPAQAAPAPVRPPASP